MVQGEFDEAIVCPKCKNDDQDIMGATINVGMFGISPNSGEYKCFKCGHEWKEQDEDRGIDADAY